ncbi:hypothetical protein [Streptomyces gibsoniae]|uniref:Uncharacterized protein n=1 Tax=Streptomyces gibsoniae TaxID=3075529 RepID=A0ABU2TVA1_9ACTN|nr:hypothetical protein [Streptomyces sp. DSM 41699]MDT0464757.1 hypothetical protein [Streptomyces sp. DSM 41699]
MRFEIDRCDRELKEARQEYAFQIAGSVGSAIVAALVGWGLMWLSGFFLATFFHWVAGIAFVVAGGAVLFGGIWVYELPKELRRPFVIAGRRQGRYVRMCDVTGREGALLKRALLAADTVRKSAAQREGVIDRARNETELPQLVWEIAVRAQATSRVAVRHERFEATGNAVVGEVLARRVAVLDESRAALEKSVGALEEYAVRVGTIDQLIALREEVEREELEAPAYMDLLASTAVADASTDAVDAISREADAAAQVLTDVLKDHYATRGVFRPSNEPPGEPSQVATGATAKPGRA